MRFGHTGPPAGMARARGRRSRRRVAPCGAGVLAGPRYRTQQQLIHRTEYGLDNCGDDYSDDRDHHRHDGGLDDLQKSKNDCNG